MDKWFRHTRSAAVIYCHDDLGPFTGPAIFRMRLYSTHLMQEYQARRKELLTARPDLTKEKVRRLVMAEFGYVDKEGELAHQDVFRSQVWVEEQKARVRKKDRQRRKRKSMDKYCRALDKLPAKSSPDAILDWIAAHPAMMRHARQGEGDGPIVVTLEDAIYAPHGPAPCRVAVNQLQAYVNRPEKFFDKVLDRQMKAGGSSEGSGALVDNLEGLDRMLKAFGEGKEINKPMRNERSRGRG